MGRFDGRVAIVTGGGHGLGRAYSRGLANEGAMVAVVDQDGPATVRVADEITEAGGKALPLTIDVSSEEATQNMAKATIEKFGRIDAIVNNAAIFQTVRPERFEQMEDITLTEWNRIMSVNVAGVFLCCKAVVPQMKAQSYGKIVNISSTTALQGLHPLAPYMVSKASVVGITRGLARELGPWNITVNTVAPGGTMSSDTANEETLRAQQERMSNIGASGGLSGVQIRAIRRVERPDDLVGTVMFLCSSDSDFVSGQLISVDGGSYMN